MYVRANEPVFTVRRLAEREREQASIVVVIRLNYYYYYYCGYSKHSLAHSHTQHRITQQSIVYFAVFLRSMPVRCFIFIIMHFKLKINVVLALGLSFSSLATTLLFFFFFSRSSISIFFDVILAFR